MSIHARDSRALKNQCKPHFSGKTSPEGRRQVLIFLGGFVDPGSHWDVRVSNRNDMLFWRIKGPFVWPVSWLENQSLRDILLIHRIEYMYIPSRCGYNRGRGTNP